MRSRQLTPKGSQSGTGGAKGDAANPATGRCHGRTRWSAAEWRTGWQAGRIMASPTAADFLGTTTLVTGGDEFIAERAIDTDPARDRRADGDADFSELPASALGPGALAEITSPSLFASMRCVVVRALEDLPAGAVESVARVRRRPAPDVALVLHHAGGVKGKAVLDKLRAAGVIEVKALAAEEVGAALVGSSRVPPVPRHDQ